MGSIGWDVLDDGMNRIGCYAMMQYHVSLVVEAYICPC